MESRTTVSESTAPSVHHAITPSLQHTIIHTLTAMPTYPHTPTCHTHRPTLLHTHLTHPCMPTHPPATPIFHSHTQVNGWALSSHTNEGLSSLPRARMREAGLSNRFCSSVSHSVVCLSEFFFEISPPRPS